MRKVANDDKDMIVDNLPERKGVLIVDDSRFSRNVLRNILSNEGYNVIGEAADGKEAIEKAKKLKPKYIFMDVEMPKLDGLGAIPAILANDPGTYIIMCTALGQKKIIVEAAKAGARDYVIKPYKKENIVNVLNLIKTNESQDNTVVPFKSHRKSFDTTHKDNRKAEEEARRAEETKKVDDYKQLELQPKNNIFILHPLNNMKKTYEDAVLNSMHSGETINAPYSGKTISSKYNELSSKSSHTEETLSGIKHTSSETLSQVMKKSNVDTGLDDKYAFLFGNRFTSQNQKICKSTAVSHRVSFLKAPAREYCNKLLGSQDIRYITIGMSKAYLSYSNRLNIQSIYDICDNKTNHNTYTRLSSQQLLNNSDITEIIMSDIIKAKIMPFTSGVYNHNNYKGLTLIMKEKIDHKPVK